MMRFAPEYVSNVLNENFEDAKELLLTPLMGIHYAHLVMLVEQGIVGSGDARLLRDALDGISLESVRLATYDGTCEDLFFFIERLIRDACGDEIAGRDRESRRRGERLRIGLVEKQRPRDVVLQAAHRDPHRPPDPCIGAGAAMRDEEDGQHRVGLDPGQPASR